MRSLTSSSANVPSASPRKTRSSEKFEANAELYIVWRDLPPGPICAPNAVAEAINERVPAESALVMPARTRTLHTGSLFNGTGEQLNNEVKLKQSLDTDEVLLVCIVCTPLPRLKTTNSLKC